MIFSLVAMAFFIRIRKETIVQYQLEWRKDSTRLLFTGFALAAGVLMVLLGFRVFLGDAVWDIQSVSITSFIIQFIQTLSAAFFIGLIEEFFFRGFIFQTLKERFRWNLFWSFVATSFFYSALHFVSAKKMYIGPKPDFFDSLKIMVMPFVSLLEWNKILSGFVGLFLFGGILIEAVLRTRSLYLAIGLHAGAVFMVKSDSLFVDFLDTQPFWIGTSKIYDGVLGWCFLLILWLGVRLFFRNIQDPIPVRAENRK